MLQVQIELAEIGLDEVIKKYGLNHKDYGHKVLLKYSTYNSPRGETVTEECRGLILSKNDWRVLSYPFKKFYNYGESFAVQIDWSSSIAEEKLDGSMIQVYFDWHTRTWYAGTTGTANGEAQTDNPKQDFNTLFWSVFTDFQKSTLVPGLTYVFELCTPWNKIVVPHTESFVRLLMIRELRTLKELPTETVDEIAKHMEVARPKKYGKSNLDELTKRAAELPFDDEGFIVVDNNMNRLKIKSNAYVRAHRLDDNGNSGSPKNMIELIMLGETDELLVYFPERKEQVNELLGLIDAWKIKLNAVKKAVIPLVEDYFVGYKVFGSKNPWCVTERLRLVNELPKFKKQERGFALLLLGNLSVTPEDVLALYADSPKTILEIIGYKDILKNEKNQA